jgi:sirohydrochlorin ferrochelatase
MIAALIDNGSLEPAAQLNLRRVAAALSRAVSVTVHPVSWKHSDRVPASELGGDPAWTLARWVRAQLARGEREFVFVPFFVSAQGAIGSALRDDLEKLRGSAEAFQFTFTAGLADRGIIPAIAAARVRETIAAHRLLAPAVIVVDHGGPSPESAKLRDALAAEVRTLLGGEISALAATSMEGAHGPLLESQLAARGFDRGDVVSAPLFLSPGRHAGPEGDLAQIVRTAEALSPGLRCHLAGLVGTHPAAVEPLADALRETLESFYAKSFA